MRKIQKRLSNAQIIILGFAAVIVLGSLVLMLPIASQNGTWTNFQDTLFTAVSAVCVTGLVVVDTGTYWSVFGQAVILSLIQVGGMGVVTISVAIAAFSGRTISLKHRSTMQDAISAPNMGGIVELTGLIIRTTLVLELLGAVFMAPVFFQTAGIAKGIWFSLFHAVSAFCNAGFDLMGTQSPFSSLTAYAVNPAINLTVMALIIIGGIGFSTWEDVRLHGVHVKKYRMQSKVILVTTCVLLLIPALCFFIWELEDLPLRERLWLSLFQAVTPRTAGFNTMDLNQLSEGSLSMTMLLMLIGGSPGSTAGGMKTTTLAVLLSTALSVFQHREHTQFFGRRIPNDTIRDAATILTMYLVLFFGSGFAISSLEGLPLLPCFFEAASAIGTVGLTLGITPTLGPGSRIILMSLMYIGRVGGLTLIFSAVSSNQSKTAKLPQEKLTVG